MSTLNFCQCLQLCNTANSNHLKAFRNYFWGGGGSCTTGVYTVTKPVIFVGLNLFTNLAGWRLYGLEQVYLGIFQHGKWKKAESSILLPANSFDKYKTNVILKTVCINTLRYIQQ